MPDLIAVLDVGKTHSKLSLVDTASGRLMARQHYRNQGRSQDGLLQLDVEGIEAWLLAALAGLPEKHHIRTLVPVAHGAACVLLDAQGEVVAAPDYEDTVFNRSAAAYDGLRDGYAQTCSPRLPAGLNLGAQLHHLQTEKAALWARTQQILTWPQYWAWRLCGVAACEVSSLGAHSDLWLPRVARYAPHAMRRTWARRLAPLRRADDVLGTIRPAVCAATGLAANCQVLCGSHDSNAAWLAMRHWVGTDQPLTLLSSGTWTIAMSSHCEIAALQEGRDMLANVDVWGKPVATARFMGGREYACIAGDEPLPPEASAVQALMDARVLALPSFVDAGGPFAGRTGGYQGLTASLDPTQRASLATLYLALMSDVMLDLLRASGRVLVEGPLAQNTLFVDLLQALRPDCRVQEAPELDGPVAGACVLVRRAKVPWTPVGPARDVLRLQGLAAYRARWLAAVESGISGAGIPQTGKASPGR